MILFTILKRITNVVRIYELLRKDDGRQYCYYQPGIGTYDAKVPLQAQSATLLSETSLAMEAMFAKYVLVRKSSCTANRSSAAIFGSTFLEATSS